MQTGLYYLAIPYNGTEEEKTYRHELSLKAAAEFLRHGIHAFAPVIYINQIADSLDLPTIDQRRTILMSHLFEYIKVAKGMIVITAEGWKESWGVRQELLYCKEHQIPVFKIAPEDLFENMEQVIATLETPESVDDLLAAA